MLQYIIHSVQEFMDFTSKILVERTNVAQRAAVREAGNELCLCNYVDVSLCNNYSKQN